MGLIDLENLGIGDRTVDAARLAYEWHTRAAPGLNDIVHYGRSGNGESGWRYAVAHEVACRLGFRSDHSLTFDPAVELAAASANFDAVQAG